ncbi:Non-specific serine/threonine protein kinase [Bertholletia excelsa]
MAYNPGHVLLLRSLMASKRSLLAGLICMLTSNSLLCPEERLVTDVTVQEPRNILSPRGKLGRKNLQQGPHGRQISWEGPHHQISRICGAVAEIPVVYNKTGFLIPTNLQTLVLKSTMDYKKCKGNCISNCGCLVFRLKKLEEAQEFSNFCSFKYTSILAATDKFSPANKLGEGGFGPVYKGILPDGQEVAIKKLSSSSSQGLEEFKNEITLIAKLQHTNLVRLLGYCIKGDKKILVYDFMPNKSLDSILFGV